MTLKFFVATSKPNIDYYWHGCRRWVVVAAVPGVVVLGRVRGGGTVIAIVAVLVYSGTALDPGEEILEMAVCCCYS